MSSTCGTSQTFPNGTSESPVSSPMSTEILLSPSTTLPNQALPTQNGWMFRSFTRDEATQTFRRILNGNRGNTRSQVIQRNVHNPVSVLEHGHAPSGRRGWPRPGPGPRRGSRRVAALGNLRAPIMFALVHLMKEAVHVNQLYNTASPAEMSSQLLRVARNMEALANLDRSTTVSQAMKKNIWSLTPQLGVPGFLMKLSSPPHALAMYMLLKGKACSGGARTV